MKKQLQKFFAKKKNNKGFTLIELIIVIAILAILVGIVGMASIRYVEKSRKSADEQMLDSISTAAQAAIVDPENNITMAAGEIKVEPTADKKDVKITVTGSTPGDFDFNGKIHQDLAKTPSFKSNFYKDGAVANIAAATSDGSVKFEGWNKNKKQ